MAISFLQTNLPVTINRIFNLSLLWSVNVQERVVGNHAHQATVQIRILTSILFALFAFIGFVLSRKEKSEERIKMLALAVGAIGVIIILGSSYNESGLQRLYLFALLPISYFCLWVFSHKTTTVILVSLMIIALPLHIISHYGNQEVDYTSPPTLASWYFIPDKAYGGLVIGEGEHGILKNLDHYTIFALDSIERELDPISKLPAAYPQYIYVTEQENKYFSVMNNNPNFIGVIRSQLDIDSSYKLIYINPDAEIYIGEGNW
jgi:hypothetical protein